MSPHVPHPHLHSAPSSSSSSPSPKAARYAATLDLARRQLLFCHPAPALAKGAPNTNAIAQLAEAGAVSPAAAGSAAASAGAMEWSELLRKFMKHNPARQVTAAAAHAELLVHTHLSRRSDPLATLLARTDAPPSRPPLVPTAERAAVVPALDALAAALGGAHTGVEVDSARAVLAWGWHAVGQPHEAQRALGVMQGRGMLAQGEYWEAYDLTLRVLACAVEGYLAEDAADVETAVAAYERTASLYASALSLLPSSDKDDLALHLVGGHALFRLSALLAPASPASVRAHVQYLERCGTCARAAVAFPAAERLWVHRSLRRTAASASSSSPPGSVDAAVLARSNRSEEALIRRGTTLPPAGETNPVYLRFLDEVVEAWRARGATRDEAGEVIEILYAALTHTFQSHLLLRHLVRALTIADRASEAAKALRLYRELWDKARETDAAEVAREMRVLRARARGEAEAGAEADGEKREKRALVRGDDEAEDRGPYDEDIDSDAAFVDTALFGVRLLVRQVGEPGEAVELARRARAVFDEGKDRQLRADKEVEARIETALGVALGALAAKEANPDRRPAQHAEALEHLAAAVALAPASSTAHYALAYQLLELRQVSRALDAARSAIERNKRCRASWHLLALCVSAQKDMRGALEVLETVLDLDGAEEGDTPDERWDRPTDETTRLDVEMQLRMTKNAVVEYLEGAPAALADQQDMLAFFSAAYSRISDVPLVQPPAATAGAPRAASGLAPPVPSVSGPEGSHRISRAASVISRRRSTKRQSVVANGAPASGPPESVSVSLANLSLADSSAQSIARSSPVGNPRATKLLVDAWLASAASFRRAGRHDEARGALGEAEALDADDPDVWSQTALLALARGEVSRAREAATKALSFDSAHAPSLILLARVYLTPPPAGTVAGADRGAYAAAPPPPPSHLTSAVAPPVRPEGGVALALPLAETLLGTLTAHGGWDVPEAWAELARCYRMSVPARRERERECLVWALQLEETRAVRPLAKAVERVL
ncbi:hypothetical protein JCM3770_006804 [Rhodotorula araucariae]